MEDLIGTKWQLIEDNDFKVFVVGKDSNDLLVLEVIGFGKAWKFPRNARRKDYMKFLNIDAAEAELGMYGPFIDPLRTFFETFEPAE